MRVTQLSVLRLLTMSAAMDYQPLTMKEAWQAYDRLFDDDRVAFSPEPAGFEAEFRRLSGGPLSSPKVWADAYLLAFVFRSGGQIVTFDGALQDRGTECLVLR